MRSFLFAFLVLFFFASPVSAQMFDMRALSRQRGFRAYQPSASEIVRPRAVPSNASRQNTMKQPVVETEETSLPEVNQDQTEKKQSRIQQKGLKIFQEKDEDKVLNFDVDNPEFKKLSKHEQQDLVSRIKYE